MQIQIHYLHVFENVRFTSEHLSTHVTLQSLSLVDATMCFLYFTVKDIRITVKENVMKNPLPNFSQPEMLASKCCRHTAVLQ